MLTIQDVNFSIGSAYVLRDINLNLEKGKIYGLLGPNGAGKTTLFKSMLGLTNYKGSISSDGRPVSTQEFGSLIEYPAFYNHLTAFENLWLHAQYAKLSSPDIDAALKQVDLSFARDKKFSQLSLGMKQRLGIARAFLGQAKYLLLDEPTNGLDPLGIKEIRLLLKERLKTSERCIVVSSHSLAEISNITDELIFIRGGRILKTMKNVYEDEKELEALYETIMNSIEAEGA
ncbi:ABC transporter ATP-binding protein [Paenibacillus sp. NEAU-GSW1]|uniref:ABC transporter ATP-binding protein n=1 Tax=Paenibacillus sp. NEAU-GSW1 TaxID=2682486 RepID=UPI0012E1F51E|nr:ATP-binding cassette domain-containing protein [Paenibacillus sp. NEAU-GSW1]MUT65156.1 ATP-binding cassette domain-containing protein [Paenibacillus sp. NEAU-GSW1]